MSQKRLLAVTIAIAVVVAVLLIFLVPATLFTPSGGVNGRTQIVATTPGGNITVSDQSTNPLLTVATTTSGIQFSALSWYTGVSITSPNYPTFTIDDTSYVRLLLYWYDSTGGLHQCGPETKYFFGGGQSVYPNGNYSLVPGSAGAFALKGGYPWNTNSPMFVRTNADIVTLASSYSGATANSCLLPSSGPVAYRYDYEVRFDIHSAGGVAGPYPSAYYRYGTGYKFFLSIGSVTVTGGSILS